MGPTSGDTITWDRLTVQLGVRWDQQYGTNGATVVARESLVSRHSPGDRLWRSSQGLHVERLVSSRRLDVRARAGPQHGAEGELRQVRDALGTTTISYTSPLGSSADAYYPWNDANGNGIVDVGEVNTSGPLLANYGYNLRDPGSAGVSANAIDPNLKAGTTSEFIAGIDHEFSPGFAVGGAYTYRKYINPIVGLPYDPTTGTIIRNTDYVQYDTLSGSLPNGTPYGPVPVYQVSPALIAQIGGYPGGSYYTNRGDYNQTYSGFDITLTKRLSNKWMARASFSYGINKQQT